MHCSPLIQNVNFFGRIRIETEIHCNDIVITNVNIYITSNIHDGIILSECHRTSCPFTKHKTNVRIDLNG